MKTILISVELHEADDTQVGTIAESLKLEVEEALEKVGPDNYVSRWQVSVSGHPSLDHADRKLILESLRFFAETCDGLDVKTLTQIARTTEKIGGLTDEY